MPLPSEAVACWNKELCLYFYIAAYGSLHFLPTARALYHLTWYLEPAATQYSTEFSGQSAPELSFAEGQSCLLRLQLGHWRCELELPRSLCQLLQAAPHSQSDFQRLSSADSLQFLWCEIRVRVITQQPTILGGGDDCFPCVLFSPWRNWGWGDLFLCCTLLKKEQWGQHVATSLTLLM